MRPIIKWAGNKYDIADQLLLHFPPLWGLRGYWESFAGAAGIFHRICELGADFRPTLSDSNVSLIAMYASALHQPEALIDLLYSFQDAYAADPEGFFATMRAARAEELTDLHRAARFIALNKTCFNGLWRENSRGDFNTSWCQDPSKVFVDPAAVRGLGEILRRTQAEVRVESFADLAARLSQNPPDTSDFFYFDPPYWPTSPTASFTSYQAGGFTMRDQVALRDFVIWLRDRGVKAAISNSNCPEVRKLYSDFRVEVIVAERRCAGSAMNRGLVGEVLALNW